MTQPLSASARSGAALPALLLLFVGSGCSALVYEIVWFQLLQLVIGSSAISLGVLLGTFMGGMCLGSLLLPRLVSADRHPLRVYAVLELGIGLFGLAVLYGIPVVDRVYVAVAAEGTADVVLRAVVCVVCLLPPTLLMGATLPAIARWVEATPAGVSWLGLFYGGNIAGAVVGCVLAGFYLLRKYDTETATFVAAAINVAVAVLGFGLSAVTPRRVVTATADSAALPPAQTGQIGSFLVYLAIGLSGFGALGAEVVWTRLLSLLIGGTVYTFSIILAVFLVGLGLGSSLGSALARNVARPAVALGVCQTLLAVAVAWAAYQITSALPYWPINPYLAADMGNSPWLNFQIDAVRCLWAVLPAAFLWGASFPLALAAVATPGRDAGKVVAGVYAANTVGAIFGAAGFSVLLVGALGTHKAQIVLVYVAGLAALVAFLSPLFRSGGGSIGALMSAAVGVPVASAVAAAVILWGVPETPWMLAAYGRELPIQYTGGAKNLYFGEGVTSSIAVTQLPSGIRNFHVSGKVEASSESQDMRLQRMLGHIPALVHPNPKSVLVVGCGAGVTAGSFLTHPSIERVVICEIEPLIPAKIAPQFKGENYDVVNDKRVQVVYDDGRHYVLTTKEKFDIITSDPIHPWVKGAATLYSQEYFELVKQRLNPGGVVTQWVPLYQSTHDVVQSEMATFFAAFPDGTVWSNDIDGKGYDVVMLGQAEPSKIDVEALDARWNQPDHAAAAKSLSDVGFHFVTQLLATYAGRGPELKPWLEKAQINRDHNLRLQYLAGLGLNTAGAGDILDATKPYRTYPDDLFVVPEPKKKAFMAWMGFPVGK